MRTDAQHVAMKVYRSPDPMVSALYRRKARRRHSTRGLDEEQLEQMPLRQGKNPRYGWRDSPSIGIYQLIDNVLKSRAGRPFDEVYSEMCERFPSGTFERFMLEQALRRVDGHQSATRICPETGEVQTTYSGLFWHRASGAYIHPTTGILHHEPRSSVARIARTIHLMSGVEEHRLAGGAIYLRKKGIWYEGEMTALTQEIGSDTIELAKADYLLMTTPYVYTLDVPTPPSWFVRQKIAAFEELYGKNPKSYCTGVGKQLNHKKLRALGLFNYYTEEQDG